MRPPPRHLVLRDLKRGVLDLVHEADGQEIELSVTLLNQYIPEVHQKDMNPNHPLESDLVNAWDVKRVRWNQFNVSDIIRYNEPFGDKSEELKENAGNTGRTGNQTPQTSQET